MAPGDAKESDPGPVWRGPRTIIGLSLGILLLLLATDLLSGSNIRIGGAMLALPALAAVLVGPGSVLIIVAAMLPLFTVSLGVNGRLNWQDAPVVLVTAVLISAAAVGASAVRVRRERELAQSRRVAARSQQIMQRPLPPTLGPLELSSVYLASDEESTIGGDLYACAMVDGRARVMVGDVQGKGLSAVEVVTYLLIAFRQAAQQHVALADLPAYLDSAVRSDLTHAMEVVAESGSGVEPEMEHLVRECFATAVVVEVTGEGEQVQVVNCGHPPPLLVHDGLSRELPASVPSLPIGLLRLDRDPVRIDTHRLAAGDTLLLYTDGLIEARDEAGVYYPIAEGMRKWGARPPADLLEALKTDLRRHARGHLVDDVAMVTVRRGARERAPGRA